MLQLKAFSLLSWSLIISNTMISFFFGRLMVASLYKHNHDCIKRELFHLGKITI